MSGRALVQREINKQGLDNSYETLDVQMPGRIPDGLRVHGPQAALAQKGGHKAASDDVQTLHPSQKTDGDD